MKRDYFNSSITHFLLIPHDHIFGELTGADEFASIPNQKEAWKQEISILKEVLQKEVGHIYFEYSIPRMGRRIDVVLLIKHVIFVIEFKVGEKEFLSSAIDQVADYALDLKNFHETSHKAVIAPIVIATKAKSSILNIVQTAHGDNILSVINTNPATLSEIIKRVLEMTEGEEISPEEWTLGKYSPTPTIIEAARALFNKHEVKNISRSDATARNLRETSKAVLRIIEDSRVNNIKSICFVTGVPGAGKTLVGLDIAAKNYKEGERPSTVYLSGNGPLVKILREALIRDKVNRDKIEGKKTTKGKALGAVKVMIQNIHNFRDEGLKDMKIAPFEHVTVFDEAQRAWNLEQTASFMSRKKNQPNFAQSEPNFLISCMDRHKDWSVIICLVGGGQEINTGEAGISEWISSLNSSFPNWRIYVSSKMIDEEYAAGEALKSLSEHQHVNYLDDLHLSVSMRSFRAEHLSLLVKNILDLNISDAKANFKKIKSRYPLVITRDISKAKQWLKDKARGTERYGIVVSSQAQRLKPIAIDVKSPMEPIHWFLGEKSDVRSSYYLEDVATEFHVQGLELDWACVTWDGDFRFSEEGWQHFSFVGSKWNRIRKEERKLYLKNAYRVILTRARQGMVIVVPNGDENDHTRHPSFYDATYEYLKEIGFDVI